MIDASLGAMDLVKMFRAGSASPVEATRAALDRIATHNARLNAFVVVDEEGALAAAHASEQRYRDGTTRGQLDGVTATIKDMLDMAGLPTRRGSRVSESTPTRSDSPVVTRLRAAGCVLLGKTTTTEFGWSGLSSSPLTGFTENPWQRGLTAGGSSAGAAAAAAAGLGVLHLGTDGAGSVRLPAHFCGVVGIKPTFGTVANVPLPNNDGLSHIGPIARRAEDALLMLQAMAGPDHGDMTCLHAGHLSEGAVLDQAPASTPWRVAYSRNLGHLRVDPDVAECVERAVRRLEREFGAVVEEVDPPWGPAGASIFAGYWATVFAQHLERPAGDIARLDPAFVAMLRDARAMTLAEFTALRARRIEYAAAVNRWLARYDFLVTPAASVAAFAPVEMRPAHWPAHPHDWIAWAGFSYPFNLAHSPALSVPAGFTPEGLPVGLQLAAPRFADLRLAHAAARIQFGIEWSWPT